MSKIIRVCAEKSEDLETVAITRGILIICFNESKTFAYGVGLKYQGGGSWGDYHIIGYNEGKDNAWQFNVGNFKPFDGFYDEMLETASNFKGFDVEDAKKYIEDTETNSMYDCFERFNKDVYNDEIKKNCTKEEFNIFGYDKKDEWAVDEEGEYHNCKLCLIKDIKGSEKAGGYLWYSENDCDEKLLNQLDLHDTIMSLSEMISGNIHFLR